MAMPQRRTILIIVIALAVFVIAWVTGRQAARSSSLTTRIYDVRDLLIDTPDFDNAPSFSLNSQNRTRPKSPATAPTIPERLDHLAHLIRATVAAQSWSQVNGEIIPLHNNPKPGLAIAQIHGHLAITQTPQVHAKIAAFLDELRESRRITITVEAKFFEADLRPDALDSSSAATQPAAFLSRTEINQLLRSLDSATVISAPRITLHSGQRAYTLISTQRAMAAGVAQVTTSDGAIVHNPVIQIAESGFVFDVQAAASSDRTTVTLTLRPQFAKLLDIVPATQRTPDGRSHSIQTAISDYKSLQMTLTIPNGQSVLTTFDQAPTTRPATQPAKRLYLLIKPTIHTTAPDAPPAVYPSGR